MKLSTSGVQRTGENEWRELSGNRENVVNLSEKDAEETTAVEKKK